jgi:hypothetical protein
LPSYTPRHWVARVPRRCHSPYPLLWTPEGKILGESHGVFYKACDRTAKKTLRQLRWPILASGTDHKENNSSHCCCCIETTVYYCCCCRATTVYHCCTFSVTRQRLLLRLYHFDILLLIPFILDYYISFY